MTFDYRNINALFPKKLRKYIKSSHLAFHLRNFFLLTLMATALFQIQILVNMELENRAILREKGERMKDYEYWESVANQFPSIPDILYNAGIASINVGESAKALGFLDQALRLDPLFKEAQELRDELVR